MWDNEKLYDFIDKYFKPIDCNNIFTLLQSLKINTNLTSNEDSVVNKIN